MLYLHFLQNIEIVSSRVREEVEGAWGALWGSPAGLHADGTPQADQGQGGSCYQPPRPATLDLLPKGWAAASSSEGARHSALLRRTSFLFSSGSREPPSEPSVPLLPGTGSGSGRWVSETDRLPYTERVRPPRLTVLVSDPPEFHCSTLVPEPGQPEGRRVPSSPTAGAGAVSPRGQSPSPEGPT